MMKKAMAKKSYIAVRTVLLALLLIVTLILNGVAIYWDSPLSIFFGRIGGKTSENISQDSEYYKSEYASRAELVEKQKELTEQISGEGAVLVKNEGALPLDKGMKISLFGLSSSIGTSSGSGSGEVKNEDSVTWATAMQNAGFEINETLLQFYANSGHKQGDGTAAGPGTEMGDWKIDEVPQKEYTSDVKASYDSYKDAAVVIFSRGGGEGGDLPIEMSRHDGKADEHYLELDTNEKALLKAVNDAGFKKTIVIINCAAAMELTFLEQEEYGVDACICVAGTGVNGLNAIAKILAGDINPSGRLVDTYVYDNFSAPSMQNFGDFRYVNADGELAGYSYVNYSEGIYVGYKYYETRYEDIIMETENAGKYNYDTTVMYPFGYGLSYTDFQWTDYSVEVVDEEIHVKVKVTNTGDISGKDVVEVYYQAPYTQYDIENCVEKASVNLVGFAKTKELGKDESEVVEIVFNISDMASYDYTGAKTYIMDEGIYYITAATDAHSAVNQILAKKGYSVDENISLDLVGDYENNRFSTFSTAITGAEISNQFDDAKVDGYTYLTRNNWAMMDEDGLTYASGTMSGVSSVTDADGMVKTITVKDEVLAELSKKGREASGVDMTQTYPTKDDYNYAAENGLELVDLIGKEYDDPMWDSLLDQLKLSEMHTLFGKAGYGTLELEAINKPKTFEYDGPAGISNMITGEGGFAFPGEVTVASTWNVELAEMLGKLVGEDGIATNTSGWYAPAMNIHRTPFSGRNFEYYSEDGILSGKIGANVASGVQSKGVYVYLKHFALNDQETNRAANGSIATWSNEQAIREIYLKPFQISVEQGHARGVMTSMNRIGARTAAGHYPLITNVLRAEWGFQGAVLTDYVGGLTGEDTDMMLSAGVDLILCTAASKLTEAKQDWCRADLRRATHNVLYNVANSVAMNGYSHGANISSGLPVYRIILGVFDSAILLILVMGICSILKLSRMTEEQFASRKRMDEKTKRIVWIISGIVLVILIIVFVVYALPLLEKAFLI